MESRRGSYVLNRWGGRTSQRVCAALAATGMLLSGTQIFAAGTLEVVVLAPGEVTVTLTAPDGTAFTEVSTTGELTLRPSKAGVHRLTITAGDQTEAADIEVPDRGMARVIYDPTATPKIQFFATVVGEITVTAQRVEENLQEVPVSVTAFTPAEIEQSHILNVQKTSLATPNMWMETNNALSSGARMTIRGVGEDASFFTSDPQVGIYVDDIYIPRQNAAQFDLFDLERLEVLRGPQGTLYGRNTSAGAVRFVTRQPGNELEAHAELTLGEYSQTDFRGAVNLPLGGKAALRVAGLLRTHDGYLTDRANDLRSGGDRDLNDQDVRGLRASLRLTPTEDLNIVLAGDVLRERSTPGVPTAFVDQPPPGPTGYGTGQWDLDQDLDGDGDPRTMQSDLEDWINDIDQWGVSGTVTWQMSRRATFKSITGYRELTHLLLLDADGRTGNDLVPELSGGPTYHLYQDQEQHQLSQELQVFGTTGTDNRFSYIAGLFYFHEENSQRTENIILFAQGENRFWDTALDTDSYAGYASLTYRASDTVNLTAGARYTLDEKVFDTEVFVPGGFPYPVDPTTLIACVAPDGTVVGSTRPCGPDDPPGSVNTPVRKNLDPTWDDFSPRFAVAVTANDNLMIYGSASRGFKSGAFDGRVNTGAAVLTLEAIPPETLWSYEVGAKSDWFSDRLRVNLAAFLNDWNDLQGSGTNPNGDIVRLSIGDVETKGLELETTAVPIEGLELTGMLALLDTRYKKANFDQEILCSLNNTGDQELVLKYSPKTSYHLGARYSTRKALGGHFSFGGSVSGKSKYYLSACNNEGGSQEPYTLVDALLAYETQDGRWRISLNGENLTDEIYLTGALYSAGLRMSPGFLNPPRRFSLSLRFNY